MCVDFQRNEGKQLCKHIPNFNHSSTEYHILNEKSFDYDYQEKIEIILYRETKDLLTCGEKKQAEIDELENRQKLILSFKMKKMNLDVRKH